MRYIGCALEDRFYDPIFFYKSDERITYYCKPDCYEWIKSIDKENELDRINWMQLMLPIHSLATQELSPFFKPNVNYESVVGFPLLDEDTPYLISIFNFFKEMDSNRHPNDQVRLERSIIFGSYPSVPNSLMERMVTYAFDNHVESSQRLRVSLSQHVIPFLKVKSS